MRQIEGNILSLIYTSAPNGLQTTYEWFANQMRICVDGTANQRCTIYEWFAYCSPQTKICQFFVRTQRELDTLCVFCLPLVRGKLINCVPNMRHTRMVQRISGALVYTRF